MKQAPQKYVMTNPEAMANGCRSFSLNAFSSPWITWPEIMREWLEAKGDPEREKVVTNTRFGESYSLPRTFDTDDENEFLERREKYGAEGLNGKTKTVLRLLHRDRECDRSSQKSRI